MTKIYKSIVSLSLLFIGIKGNAQVAPYAFTQSSGVYTAITGGTVYGTTATDDDVFVDPSVPAGNPSGSQGVGIPIGFNFTYNSTTYNVIGIDNNGWISFGSSLSTPGVDMNTNSYAAVISNASTATSTLQNRVAAFNRDLQGQTGSTVRVQNLGVTPNQTLVIQWENYRAYNTTGDNFNFQIRLSQTSNIIQVVYGSYVTTTPNAVQVGLRGMSISDYNNRDVSTSNLWSTSIAGASNAAIANFNNTLLPASGQIYQWAPPTNCTGAPSAGVVSASQTICPNTTAVVTNTSSNPFSGITYQWMQAPSASGPWTNVTTGSGFNTQVLTTTSLTSQTFYQLVITCATSAQSATTAVTSVNPNNPPTLCYCNTNLGGSGCTGDNITNVTIIGTPLNNNSTCNSNAINGTYTYFSPGPTTTATLNLGVTYSISINTTASNIESVWIDYNQSGTFDISEHTQVTLSSTANVPTIATFTVPGTALLGQTGMRVRSRGTGNPNGPADACTSFGSGETEDYIVTIAAAAACSGAPGANSAVASMTTICPSSSVTLGLANSYTVGGLTYQWFSAPAVSGPYTSISTATSAIYTATNVASTTFYQVVITCTNGPASTTSTPVQVLVSGNPCQCAGYCLTSAPTNVNDDEIFNVSIGTLNNTTACGQTGGPTSTVSLYSNYTGIVAAPNLIAGSNYTLDVTVGQCNGNPYSGGVTVYMDFNNNGLFTDPNEQVYVGPSTSWAVAGTLNSTVITIPPTAIPGITRMRVIAAEGITNIAPCASYGYGETEDYCVNIVAAAPCAGAPGANSSMATSTNVCPGGSSNLSLATSYTVGGLTYQWFSAPAVSGPYTPILGATLSTYAATNITTSTFYQAVITCTNGPASTTATPVQVLVGGSPCQCAAYCLTSFPFSTNDDEIFNVSIGTLNNTSTCGQTGGPTSTVSLYSNYAGIIASPNLAAGVNYTFNVTVGQCNLNAYSGGVTIYMDFNQNGSFADPGEQVFASPSTLWAVSGTNMTGVISIPVGATLGTTRMRVIAAESNVGIGECVGYGYGETEDYCITITPPTPCAGTPGANSAVTTITTVCPSGTVGLSLANSYTVGGLTYQWFSSPSISGPYTAISGATVTPYTVTNITGSLFYQAVITCTNGPASTTSTPVQVVVNSNPCSCSAYCASNATQTQYDEILNVTIGTLNNSSSCSQTGGPTSILNEYSNYAGIVAAPTISAGTTYNFSVTVGMCNATFANSGIVSIYMDFNNNGSFSDPGELTYTSPYTSFAVAGTTIGGNILIPTTATGGITRMRVIEVESSVAQPDCGTYFAGETEDYCINVIAAPPCAGTPNPGTITATQTLVCSGTGVTMNLSGFTASSGLTFQWFSSPNSTGPWTAVSGATATALSTSITANIYYQVIVACGTNTAATAAIQFSLLPVTACYCNQNLGGSGCSGDNITNVSIIGTPLNNNSTCNSNAINGTYTQFMPGPTTTATLNLSTTYTISVNTTANNIESVWIDYDHSGTFDAVEHTQICLSSVPNTATTATFTVPGTAQLGLTGMRVRSRGTGNPNGPTDACTGFGSGETEDYFVTIAPGCVAPNVTLTASQSTICSGNAVTLTASGATTYTWNTAATTNTISVSPSATAVYTVTGENLPGCPTSKTISIVVKPSPTLSYSAAPGLTLCPGAQATLTAVSSAGNYTWNPGNFNTSAISVTPAISTVYNVATTNSLGCTTNSNITVFVVVCTGIAKNTVIDNSTFIYPNPNSGNINVVIQDASGSYSFEVLDLAGRVVYKTTLNKAESALSIKDLANGMYTYKIISATTKVAIKEGKLIKE